MAVGVKNKYEKRNQKIEWWKQFLKNYLRKLKKIIEKKQDEFKMKTILADRKNS